MRLIRAAIASAAIVGSQGCAALEFLGGSCTQEQIVVTWPATITRGSAVSNALLTTTLTPSNIDQTEFNELRSALVNGGPVSYRVTWTVSAFDTNGGYIAFSHEAPMEKGQSLDIGATFDGGGWGASPAVGTAPRPVIAVRADNFSASSASGSITALDRSPLRLHIDVVTRSASGETMHLTGDAGFAYQKVTKTCT